MELLLSILTILRDPSVPSHRVVRKAALLTGTLVCALAYYRHVTLGFGFAEPLLVTLGLAFILLAVVGVFGGLLAGAFYDAFRKDIGAQKRELTIAVFFAEWLFAITTPLLGVGMFASLISHMP